MNEIEIKQQIQRHRDNITRYIHTIVPIFVFAPGFGTTRWLKKLSEDHYYSNEVKIMRKASWFGIGLGIFIIIFPFIYSYTEYGTIKIAVNLVGSGLGGIVGLTFIPMIIIYSSTVILFSIRELKKIDKLEKQIGIIHPPEPPIVTRSSMKINIIAIIIVSIIVATVIYISTTL